MEKDLKYSPNNKGLSIVCSFLLVIANLMFLFWTVILFLEQIKTGWGYGTDLGIMGLIPIIVFFLTIPSIILELVFLVLSYFFKVTKKQLIYNVIFFMLLLLQIGMNYVFIIM